MTTSKSFVADQPGGKLNARDIQLPPLGPEEIQIDVESCGICHSDLSMLQNEWGITQYPFVGGHEVIGKVAKVGEMVPNLKVGDRVGLGWTCRSCMHCLQCLSGDQHLCAQAQGTITHQSGGFGEKVQCHWAWAIPIDERLDPMTTGPLLCGGITVFAPLVQHNLSPTARVGVVGIGGLGHMAILFADAWGCEVTAISRSRSKEQEARELGADDYIATGEDGSLQSHTGKFDLIINTTNVPLPWDDYIAMLAPKGILHTVGAAPKIEATVFPLIMGQKSLSSSPTGNIVTLHRMLDFAARHQIAPVTEQYEMNDINEAFEKLHHGSPRYRLVLKA